MKAAQESIYMSAKVHARDGLLPRVTTLRVRDRAELVEVRLLGNCGIVHVDSPLGPPRFDTGDVPCARGARNGTRSEQSIPNNGIDAHRCEHFVAFDIELGVTRD